MPLSMNQVHTFQKLPGLLVAVALVALHKHHTFYLGDIV